MNKHVSPQMNRRAFVIGTAAIGTGLALGLDFCEDIRSAVVELRTAEQDARKVHRRSGQPAVLADVHDYRDVLSVPGNDLRPLVRYRTDHFAEALLSVLDLPVIRSW